MAIINAQKFITPIFWLTLASLIALPTWRNEGAGRSDSVSNTMENYSPEEISVSHLYRSSVLPAEEVDSATASSVNQSSDNSFRASDSIVDMGEPLNADAFNGHAENETLPVNIGEPLDADSPLTDYTYETAVDLGEPLDVGNPSLSNIDEPSEYRNIGPDMIVEEENFWQYDEPRNIGPMMAVDEVIPN